MLYGFAFAQEPKYPTKPITIAVGYAPGGTTDIVDRRIGQQITKAMGQPVIIENRPGASQNIACEYVDRAPKDRLYAAHGFSGFERQPQHLFQAQV